MRLNKFKQLLTPENDIVKRMFFIIFVKINPSTFVLAKLELILSVMGFLNISFFKTPEHRVFHYEPRYYDPQKEQLQKIYEKYGKNPDGTPKVQGTEDEANYNNLVSSAKHIPGESIRGSFQNAYKESRRSAGNPKLKTIITIIALIMVFIAAYYLADSLVYLLEA